LFFRKLLSCRLLITIILEMTMMTPLIPLVRLVCVLLGLMLCGLHTAQGRGFTLKPQLMEGSKSYTYKQVDDLNLDLWVFSPQGQERAPAVIFFFGGGWNGGTPAHFVPQSKYLAKRGIHGIVVHYRVKSRNGVKARSCVEDANDALIYVTKNATELGIDPTKIAVGGGSAGGHLAACLGTISAQKDYAPKAMILYNPVSVLVPVESSLDLNEKDLLELEQANEVLMKREAEFKARLGVEPIELSPFHHISAKTPPTLIFHGTADTIVPYISARAFTEQLKKHSIDVTFHTYENCEHSFFGREPYFSQTIEQLDTFLVHLGWLKEK